MAVVAYIHIQLYFAVCLLYFFYWGYICKGNYQEPAQKQTDENSNASKYVNNTSEVRVMHGQKPRTIH